MFAQRNKGLGFTDKRVRITTEVLQGIRLIKFYAWEAFYVQQIGILRRKEVQTIRAFTYVFSFILSLVLESSSWVDNVLVREGHVWLRL